MGATSITEDSDQEQIIDDLKDEVKQKEAAVEAAKLAELRAKSQAKQESKQVSNKIIGKKERSLNFGVIGSGQGGSRLAECFFSLGYNAIALNTAIQDLRYINLPDSSKLLLEFGVGGASKELEIGKAAAEAHRGEIAQLINEKLSDSQVNVICASLGGGSGAGSCEVLIDILSEVGKPIVVMTVLPMDTEDAQTKQNAVDTLVKLSNFAKTKKIANLIVADNAKIEAIYSDVSQMDFYGIANKVIVSTLDAFNTFSSMPSAHKSLDPMEFSKILIDGDGLTIYGELTVENYSDDVSIAEAIINNLDGNLLSSNFDLKQTKYAGFIIAANKEVWSKIPASSINYASSIINDFCGNPKGVFKGIYTTESTEDVVKVYSIFSGLGMPGARLDQLKKDTLELQSKIKMKDEARSASLTIDTGTNETVSAAQKVKDKIAAKSSNFGRFLGGTVDRRKP